MEAKVWSSWSFANFESLLLKHAADNGLEYDPAQPLAMFGASAPQRAVKAMGTNYVAMSENLGKSYKTVASWFSPSTPARRRMVMEGTFPALCEAYSARIARGSIRLLRAEALHSTEIEISKADVAYFREVEFRVYFLLAKGEVLSEGAARLDVANARDDYYRSALVMAAGGLKNEELAVAARVALQELASQTWQTEEHTLSEAVRLTELYSAHADRRLSAEAENGGASESDVLRELRRRLDRSSAQLVREGIRGYLERTSDARLSAIDAAVRKEVTARRGRSHEHADESR